MCYNDCSEGASKKRKGGKKMSVSKPWDVYDEGEWIDTVWFDPDMEAYDIRRSLIDHDRHKESITVSPA
jgi:hypothetical protein